jgi:hypothetical protein
MGTPGVVAVNFLDTEPASITGIHATCLLGPVSYPPNGFSSIATNDDGTTIFVGSHLQWGGGFNTAPGEIMVFHDASANWDCGGIYDLKGPDARLVPPATWSLPFLTGTSISASGDWAVAGAPRASVDGLSQAGKVFVWKMPEGGWISNTSTIPGGGEQIPGLLPIATLTAPNPEASAWFGEGSKIFADGIAVAAPGATVGANASQGKAYLFREPAGGWSGEINTPLTEFVASDGTTGNDLGGFPSHHYAGILESGTMLTMASNMLVVGAPEQGKPVYVFGAAVNDTIFFDEFE